MSPTLFTTEKEPQNANAASTLGRPYPPLTENQAKTVAFRRQPGGKNRPRRVRMFKDDKEYLKAKEEAPPTERAEEKPKKRRIKIDLQLPISVPKDAADLLQDLKTNRNPIKLTFSDSLRNGSKIEYVDADRSRRLWNDAAPVIGFSCAYAREHVFQLGISSAGIEVQGTTGDRS